MYIFIGLIVLILIASLCYCINNCLLSKQFKKDEKLFNLNHKTNNLPVISENVANNNNNVTNSQLDVSGEFANWNNYTMNRLHESDDTDANIESESESESEIETISELSQNYVNHIYKPVSL